MHLSGIIKEHSLFILSVILFGSLQISKQDYPMNLLINKDRAPREFRVISYPLYMGVGQEFYVQLNNAGLNQKIKVITKLDKEIHVDDKLIIEGRINVTSITRVGSVTNPEIIKHEKGEGLLYEISRFRSDLLKTIHKNWHGQNAALFSGLLIGADYDYSPKVIERFKNTLTMHILVVSGFNIEFLHGSIMRLSVLFGRKKTYLISMFIMVFYCLIVGIDNIPCQRAFIMTFISIFTKLIQRRVQKFQIWGLALMVLLILNPHNANEISLQLSFLASAGMICAGYIKKIFKPNWLIEGLIANLLCNVFVLPIIIRFGNAPTLGSLIANILIAPLIPLVITSGLLAIISSLFLIPSAGLFNLITDLQLDMIFIIVGIANII